MTLTAKPGCCEEAALGLSFYAPCNKPAVNVVGWKGRSDSPIRMCAACTDHNVRNRGGEVLRPFTSGAAIQQSRLAIAGLEQVARQYQEEAARCARIAMFLLAEAVELKSAINELERPRCGSV